MIAVLLCAAVAAIVSGTVGFGAVLLILPALAALIGLREAIPLLSVVALFASGFRAALSWREIDWVAIRGYALVAAVCALPGALLFPYLNMQAMAIFLGVLTVAVVPGRRWAQRAGLEMQQKHLPLLGVGVGLLTGTGATVGSMTAPFLLSYGLRGSAFLGTEGLAMCMAQVVKTGVFGSSGLIRPERLPLGVALLAILIAGAWLGKRIADRTPPERYAVWVEAAVVVAGLVLVAQGLGWV